MFCDSKTKYFQNFIYIYCVFLHLLKALPDSPGGPAGPAGPAGPGGPGIATVLEAEPARKAK